MNFRKSLLLLTLVFLGASFAPAQTTIMNTPATNVVAPGQTYVEFDYSSHLTRFSNGGNRTYGFRAIK